MLAVSDLVLQACISFFGVFQTEVAHFYFCLVRIRKAVAHVLASLRIVTAHKYKPLNFESTKLHDNCSRA